MVLASVHTVPSDFPALMNSAADAKHTNASNKVYSTRSWPFSSRANRRISCIMSSVLHLRAEISDLPLAPQHTPSRLQGSRCIEDGTRFGIDSYAGPVDSRTSEGQHHG